VDATLTLRGRLAAGIVAGVGAALLIVLFLFMLQWDGAAPAPAAFFTFAAAALLGPAAYANPAGAAIGVGLIFVLAIGWALGYVYLARSQPQLVSRPFVSGAVFGVIVYIFTQIALLTAGLYHRPTPDLLGKELIGHLVFYGIPVALIVASFARRRTT
jgi:hypothetical protein